jgi:hypothetical protein
MRSPRQLHHDTKCTITLDERLETEHAEYDLVAYEYIAGSVAKVFVELRAFFRRI